MIKIELVDGRVLPNDPALGFNLDSVAEIEECLQLDGGYYLTIHKCGPERILCGTVKRVYEEE